MKYVKALFIMAVGLAIWLAGCDVQDPGSPKANFRPTVELSVAPQNGDTVENNKSLEWWGNDADGQIVGYHLFVDGVSISFTSATDTIIAFPAPVEGEYYLHSFGVVAEDNEGLLSDLASDTFYVYNWAPVADFEPSGTIAEGATVGRDFRISVLSIDTNTSIAYYNISLDDTNHWIGWQRDSVFLFAAPEIIADTVLFPPDVYGVPNEGLTVGAHTLFARVKDAGGAISSVISLHFTVAENFRPQMDTTVVASYGDDAFYLDGSVYYSTQIGLDTRVEFSASAAAYSGEINAYRWQLGEGEWSEWTMDPVIVMTDAAVNDYNFHFTARDMAGTASDTISYFIRIVGQTLSDSVIIVDETVDGNGGPGSPTDAQADQFYTNVLQDYKTRQIDYATHKVGLTSYVSPYDIRNAGVIVWHGDDQGAVLLGDNTRILGEFLDRGGRLVISGWNLLRAFTSADTVNSIEFSSSSFATRRLRLYAGQKNTTTTTLGFSGVGEFPGCRIDSTKLPVSFHGRIPKCWALQPSGECLIMGRMMVSDSLTSSFQARTTAYLYYQSFRVAVFGVPLYFCVESEVRDLMQPVMNWMLQGLQ
jgi:hypothetical protein